MSKTAFWFNENYLEASKMNEHKIGHATNTWVVSVWYIYGTFQLSMDLLHFL